MTARRLAAVPSAPRARVMGNEENFRALEDQRFHRKALERSHRITALEY